MTPLLKKEIRLILPAWSLTLLLAVATALLFRHSDSGFDFVGPVWLGVLVLCASSFGREFSLGTFSALLAQPVPRQQYWRVKVGVLVAALFSAILICYLCLVWFQVGFATGQGPAAVTVGLLVLTAIAGGLWMALLIRQMIAVVWLIVLIPAFLCVPFLLVLAHFNAGDATVENTVDALLLIYSVGGIVGSWLIFRRAQDTPWSGGTITLPEWLSVGAFRSSAPGMRVQVPWRALVWKELHFNQVLLFGMGGLFLLDLGEVGVRFLRQGATGDLSSVLQVLGIILWFVVALIIGCTSIAEERKLGTLENQLCQPVSARRQFLVKLGFVVLFGGLLSSFLPMAAEFLAQSIGAGRSDFSSGSMAAMAGGMTALALIGLFASSLTRNVLQALPAAIGTIVVIALAFVGFNSISGMAGFSLTSGLILWDDPGLPDVLLTGLLSVALPWLAYRNFRCLHEASRVWWRNSLVLAAVLAFTMVASAAIYHRAWDKLTPFEPAHGPAYWTGAQKPVALRTDINNNLLVTLPDGRAWFGCLTTPQPQIHGNQAWALLHDLFVPGPAPQLTIHSFIENSGWVSLAPGYADFWAESGRRRTTETERAGYVHIIGSRDTVGIQNDGTLWVSSKPSLMTWNTNELVQFGAGTNWQQVMGDRTISSVLLLKKDGTLWRWGDRPLGWVHLPPGWQGLRACTPQQIGTNSDWQRLAQVAGSAAAQKTDGSVWHLWFDTKAHTNVFELVTNMSLAGFTRQRLDDTKLTGDNGAQAGVRADGTLWIWGHLYWDWQHANRNGDEALQSGRETNWVAVALHNGAMVALKSDGTLWGWGRRPDFRQPADAFTVPPVRLGSHQDWVALAQTWEGIVSLAADGSLWLWPDYAYHSGVVPLIEPSQKPIPLGNILATASK